MRRLVATLVVLGVALSGVVATARAQIAGRGRRPTRTVSDQPDLRPLASGALPEEPAISPAPAVPAERRRRASDREQAPEAERLRAAWAYVPGTSSAAVTTAPPPRSRRLVVLAALGLLAGIAALGLAMRPPTSGDLAGPSPRAVAGFESTPVPSATVRPTPTPSPTIRPATTASSTQFAPVSIPDDTVRAYYARAAAHEYTAAAALWYSPTGQPVGTESIERRFAATQAITVSITEVAFQGPSLATVAARIEEVTATGTDRYEVLWELVNVDGRWLLANALTR